MRKTSLRGLAIEDLELGYMFGILWRWGIFISSS